MTTQQILAALPEVSGPLQTAAPDRLEVIVAERHIMAGRPGQIRHCAIALALREAGHNVKHVSPYGLEVDAKDYRASEGLADWIIAFDRGDPVHPERWVLEPIRTTPKPFRIGTTQTVHKDGFGT